MKRIGTFVIITAMVALGASLAFAHGWGHGGGWGGPMMGNGYGMGPGYMTNQPAQTSQEWAQFQKDTLAQRQKLATKGLELQTLYAQPNPDRQRTSALEREVNDLREQIAAKAPEGGTGYGAWGGHMRGYGMGYGPGYCWSR